MVINRVSLNITEDDDLFKLFAFDPVTHRHLVQYLKIFSPSDLVDYLSKQGLFQELSEVHLE